MAHILHYRVRNLIFAKLISVVCAVLLESSKIRRMLCTYDVLAASFNLRRIVIMAKYQGYSSAVRCCEGIAGMTVGMGMDACSSFGNGKMK